jgi:ABC-type multidrug transport system fused ATPase/permease subunit
MSHLVKVKVRPGGTVQFPGDCVHCLQPANQLMSIKKRSGQLTRLIDVPLCPDCHHEVHRQSGEEERLSRLGKVASSLTAVIVFLAVILVSPGGFSLVFRLAIALTLALIVAFIIFSYFRSKRRAAALPEKRAILDSALMSDFSWRATTFEFTSEGFATRFENLNQSKLMEVLE